MTRGLLTLVFLVLGSILTARGEFWTNQAGKVIEGRIESIAGSTILLVRTNGSQMKIPLQALAQPDQRRALSQVGRTFAPEFVQVAYRDACAILEQFDRLAPELRTEAAATKARRLACSVFDARLKPRSAELQQTEVQTEVQRLRAALSGENS